MASLSNHFFQVLKTTLIRKTLRPYATQATFKTNPLDLHHLDTAPAPEITLTKEEALQLYERMATIRRLENTANKLYKAKIVRGFCHLYIGQEAVAVGITAKLRPQDIVATTYRCHAWAYLLGGFSVKKVIGELVGVQSGSERGKGGSMHMYNDNLYGGNAIVGAQVPLGAGIALAQKYRNTGGLAIAAYGDGAANSGQVFEAYNMAKLWNLPCIFLCENNLYSMGTSIPRSTANPEFYKRGDSVPGIRADGMDVITMSEVARFCVEHITNGKGPIVLEAVTYRYFGHSLSDPGTSYRTREEVSQVRQARDPISHFKTKILDAQLATPEELKQIDSKIKTLIDQAEKEAVKDKSIPVEELTHDIYVDYTAELRGVSPFKPWKHKYSGQAKNLK